MSQESRKQSKAIQSVVTTDCGTTAENRFTESETSLSVLSAGYFYCFQYQNSHGPFLSLAFCLSTLTCFFVVPPVFLIAFLKNIPTLISQF